MRKTLPRFCQEAELRLLIQGSHPALGRARCRRVVKRTVDLHAVEVAGNRPEPFRRFPTRIDNVLPIGVTPARAADKNRTVGHARGASYRVIASRKTFLTLRH